MRKDHCLKITRINFGETEINATLETGLTRNVGFQNHVKTKKCFGFKFSMGENTGAQLRLYYFLYDLFNH